MSAVEVIQQIKKLPANERAKVARFFIEAGPPVKSGFSVSTEADGLPVIQANNGETITSKLVHEIESRTS